MTMTAEHDRALEDLDAQLFPVRQQREKTIALVKTIIDRVSAQKSFRNPLDVAKDARLSCQALDEYRGIVGQMELSLALSGGNSEVANILKGLHINNYGKELSCSPLLRALGAEAELKSQMKRIEAGIKKATTQVQQQLSGVARLRERLGIIKRLAVVPESLRSGAATTPAINIQSRSARFIITTNAVDAEGEVIIPRGVDFKTRYALNPVVLWEHGMSEAIEFPIGKSIHPDGSLALEVTDDYIAATCYFATDPDAERIWRLVQQKVVSAASIHVLPLERTNERINGQFVTVYPRSLMVEWSLGRMGVNHEAVIARG